MESINERHILDAGQLARLAKTVRTLITLGQSLNKAVYAVAFAHGLTLADVAALRKLV